MTQEERIQICKNCNYSNNYLGVVWCGQPLIGEKVIHEEKNIRLCGCNMNIKTKFTKSKCPAKKWK
jgi:hypothetical protein